MTFDPWKFLEELREQADRGVLRAADMLEERLRDAGETDPREESESALPAEATPPQRPE